jgi:hypothetical protein
MRPALLTLALLLSACGGSAPARAPASARLALTQLPERVGEASRAQRAAWFEELLRASAAEAGQPATAGSLFPLFLGERSLSAPALDFHADLLTPSPAHPARLACDPRSGWSEQPDDLLGGLSEREAAEWVARALLSRWGIPSAVPVQLDRAVGAPYAAAWVDGVLRLNPAFVLLAASAAD